MCRFHGDETGVAVMGPIARVCAGDFVEVAVSIYSGGGRVALDRVSWLPLRQERRRQSLPSKGFFSPEACPLEWSAVEWFPADEFRLMSTERVKDPGMSCTSSTCLYVLLYSVVHHLKEHAYEQACHRAQSIGR